MNTFFQQKSAIGSISIILSFFLEIFAQKGIVGVLAHSFLSEITKIEK